MTDLILTIAVVSLTMTAVLVLILLLSQLLGRRFTAKCRYIIWTVIILRLCIPFGAAFMPTMLVFTLPDVSAISPISDINVVQPSETEPDYYVSATQMPDITGDTVYPAQTALSVTENLSGDDVYSTIKPFSVGDILTAVAYVWLAAAALFLLWQIISYNIFTVKLKRSFISAPEKTRVLYDNLCIKSDVKKAPALYISGSVSSPLLCGFVKPKIILPDIELTPNSLVGILMHELTHYRRYDLWIKFACLFAKSLHWFNPLVYIAANRCNSEMELSCDESVLAGFDDEVRLSYGNVMLDIIKRCKHRGGMLTTQFNPKTRAVQERFANILDGKKKKRGRLIIAIIALICAAAGTVVGCNIDTGSKNYNDNETDNSDTINTGNIDLTGLDSINLTFLPFTTVYEPAKQPIEEFTLSEIHVLDGDILTFYYIKDEYCDFYCEWSDGSTTMNICSGFFTYRHFSEDRFKVSPFKDVLGKSGFKITWSNKFNKPHTEYFIYENNLPVLYFAGDYITETDLDMDGDSEILTFGHDYVSACMYDRHDSSIYICDIESAVKQYAGDIPVSLQTFYINDNDSGFKKGCFVFHIYNDGFRNSFDYSEFYAVYINGSMYFTDKTAVVSTVSINLPEPEKYENAVPQMTDHEKHNFVFSKLNATYEAYFWFIGDTISGVLHDVRLSDDGQPYIKIVNAEYPDYASFTAHLVSLFSPEISASLLTGGFDYSKYINFNGELWGISTTGGRQLDLTYGDTEYTIISSTDTEIVIKGLMSRMRDITNENSEHIEVELDYYEEYGYTLEYLNGAWVFTEFEKYMGRIEPDEIINNN